MISLVQINSWKSRNPLDILTGDDDFDIICIQEPNHNEIFNVRKLHGYAHIFPNAHKNHCVSVLVKLSTIPASCICPRPDLSKDGDIIVIEFTFGCTIFTLINLYNDSVTRAGVKLLRFALPRLHPRSKTLVTADSNSHHPHWDVNTKTPMCNADFDFHNTLVEHGLVLVTPPDVPTHISGNVIDLSFCSRSLFMDVDATVDPSLCVGSDHLPIHYSLNFDNVVTPSKSIKFNADRMDLDIFLGTLRAMLGSRPLPIIRTLEELDTAVDFLNEVILAA
ncbi:Endonuclease/exonuclease/phosphatase, partial [Mycena metata]